MFKRKRLPAAFLIALAACLLSTSTVTGQSTSTHSPASTGAGARPMPRMMPGLAVASQSAELAVTVNQQLAEVHVSEGQRVQRGELLATLENGVASAEYEAALAIAEDNSAVAAARIDVEAALRKLQRIEEAAATGASNAVEIRAAQNAHVKAQAALQIEQSRMKRAVKIAETARHRMEAFNIRAPFDGTITRRFVSVGNMVSPGQPVFSMIAADTLRIELNLPTEFFGVLEQGQTYELSGGAPVSQKFEAELQFVSPAIDAATQSFRCVFVFDNRELHLPSGFPAQLSPQQAAKLLGHGNQPGA